LPHLASTQRYPDGKTSIRSRTVSPSAAAMVYAPRPNAATCMPLRVLVRPRGMMNMPASERTYGRNERAPDPCTRKEWLPCGVEKTHERKYAMPCGIDARRAVDLCPDVLHVKYTQTTCNGVRWYGKAERGRCCAASCRPEGALRQSLRCQQCPGRGAGRGTIM